MKTFFIIIFSLLLSIQLLAQKSPLADLDLQRDGNYYQKNHMEPFTGVAFEDHKSGKKKTRAEFKNGKLNGKVTTWHETGEKSTLVNYKNGISTGIEFHWYDTGVKKLEINYDGEGLASGICKEYFTDGKLKSEGEYVKDLEEGLHKWYFQSGELDQTIVYKGGLANGKVKHYYDGGKMKMDADYKDANPYGKVILFFENGEKKKETNYVVGKEEGRDFLWSNKGLLLEERTYKNGEEIGYKNFRSGAIKTKEGFLQVFNEKESFFTIHVSSPKWVRSKSSRDITYVVDDFVLQLFNTSTSSFINGSGLADSDVLMKHMEYEKGFIEKGTKSVIDIQHKFGNYKGGSYLHWSFENPALKDVKQTSNRTVTKEHYFTFVCNKQILILYVPQTKGNNESKILKDIQKIANSLGMKSESIDMNQLRITIRENSGLPPLPANEMVKGYKKDGER
ncbi:MAG: antitoxin component YwqK of YwqJK toxin-antitoxin module [Maribacter sp.]|jgi:antitoxin component YwqK of YwqJK toxin-antitoxin module